MGNGSKGRTMGGSLDCREHLLNKVTITAAAPPGISGEAGPHVGCPHFRIETASEERPGQEWPRPAGNRSDSWGHLTQRTYQRK